MKQRCGCPTWHPMLGEKRDKVRMWRVRYSDGRVKMITCPAKNLDRNIENNRIHGTLVVEVTDMTEVGSEAADRT